MNLKQSQAIEKANPFDRLSKNISEDKEFNASANGDGTVYLTPYLSLIVAILYMMSADGDISEQECNHLLSVFGGDNQVLQRALRYVELNSVDEFLAEVPDVVSEENRLCILLNVCDSSMSDGDFDKSEMILFSRMLGIFGQNKHSFKPYFETISIKNKHSVLEVYEKSELTELTPPLALAASMLYMMSVDGDIAKEEIGQINVSIRKFKDILPTALKYVKKIKFHDYIKLANSVLTHQQKLCILVNVCDCMLADGHIDRLEQDLFRRMLAGFDITAQNFNKHFQNLSLKNEKPSDIRKAIKSESQREIIINSFNTDESKQFADTAGDYSKNNVKAPHLVESKNKFGAEISKKIEANSQKSDLQNQLENEVDVISINANALEKDKKEKPKNRNSDGTSEQRRLHDTYGGSDKRQYKPTEGPSYQRQMVDADGPEVIEIERETAVDNEYSNFLRNEEDPLHTRMGYLKVWTDKLKNNLDKFETINIHHSIKRSTGLDLLALKPDYPPALALAAHTNGAKIHMKVRETSNHQNTGNIHMNANDLPIANESNYIAVQSRTRLKLAAITTGLIITQGFTNYGLNETQNTLLINQALTSNLHISVQAANLKQTEFNLTADLMDKIILTNNGVTDDGLDKSKFNSETYRSQAQRIETAPQTNDGKKELKEKITLIEKYSATQLIKMKWFGMANSALMLGFFMTFFGLLFRSKMSVAGSSVMFAVGTLLTINGFYLVV